MVLFLSLPHNQAGVSNVSQLWQGLVMSPDGRKVAMKMLIIVGSEGDSRGGNCRLPPGESGVPRWPMSDSLNQEFRWMCLVLPHPLITIQALSSGENLPHCYMAGLRELLHIHSYQAVGTWPHLKQAFCGWNALY